MPYKSEAKTEHVAETVEQLSRLYEEHDRSTTRIQRIANGFTARLGQPATLIAVTLAVIGWILVNLLVGMTGSVPYDRYPFPSLEFVATVTALLVALLILTAQRSQDQLADKRARLTLQIAALSEKKIAKVIQLLEEQRDDNPLLPTREDNSADEMAESADPTDELTTS